MRFNPRESLSLKGNRCRFTYVEGPQPVMRLAGWDLSLQQLEGEYSINAQSSAGVYGAWPSESHRTKANEAHGRLAHMGTGLLTDCTSLSLVVGQGFKGLYTERGALGGPLLHPLHNER